MIPERGDMTPLQQRAYEALIDQARGFLGTTSGMMALQTPDGREQIREADEEASQAWAALGKDGPWYGTDNWIAGVVDMAFRGALPKS
jgi:hypothetical protein